MMRRGIGSTFIIGALAGLCGGLAEVLWIWLYAALTNGDAERVARAVANAVEFGGQMISPALAGIFIHMGLAVMLGIGIAFALCLLGRWSSGVFVPVIAALKFVHVVPYGASLVSKLMFGVAAAFSLRLAEPAQFGSLRI
jgi:hypothetical protein